jgi:ABC-type lipoprotein release transport system permease subunit
MDLRDKIALSFKAFTRQKYKTVGTIAILSVAIIVFNVVYSLFTYIKDNSDVNITNNDSLKYIQIEPLPNKELTQEDLDSIKKIPGVEAAFFSLTSNIAVEYKDKGFSATLLGLDPDEIKALTKNDIVLDDKSIILNDSFKSSGITAGEKTDISFNVAISSDKGVRKTKTITVKDYFTQPDLLYLPQNVCLANKDLVVQILSEFYSMTPEMFLSQYYPSNIIAIASNLEDVSYITEEIEKKGLDTKYSLKSSKELPLFAKVIRAIGAVAFLILIIFGGINIASSISQSIRSRYKHIGILKAMGFSSKNVFDILFYEVIYIGLISFVIAQVLSIIIIFFINLQLKINMNNGITIGMNALQVIISAVLILITIALSSVYNISKASKMSSIECMRSE